MSQKRQVERSRAASHPGHVRTLAVRYSTGYVIPVHTHEWHQLIYASEGVMTVHTPVGSWVVPPQRAVWVPAGIEHSIEMSGAVAMRTLYLHLSASNPLSTDCRVVNVSPLLRELILHTVTVGTLEGHVPAQARLIDVILDQLAFPSTGPLHLPLPRDARARRVAQILSDDPSEPRSLAELWREAGASRRTVERLFRAETGLTFGRWRQQLRLLHALRLLARGEPVTTVALEVGYEGASAFIAMFKRAFKTTPSRYFRPVKLERSGADASRGVSASGG